MTGCFYRYTIALIWNIPLIRNTISTYPSEQYFLLSLTIMYFTTFVVCVWRMGSSTFVWSEFAHSWSTHHSSSLNVPTWQLNLREMCFVCFALFLKHVYSTKWCYPAAAALMVKATTHILDVFKNQLHNTIMHDVYFYCFKIFTTH